MLPREGTHAGEQGAEGEMRALEVEAAVWAETKPDHPDGVGKADTEGQAHGRSGLAPRATLVRVLMSGETLELTLMLFQNYKAVNPGDFGSV